MGPWTRVFVALLAASLPAITLATVALLSGWQLSTRDRILLAGALVLFEVGWLMLLSAAYGRLVQPEPTSIVGFGPRSAPTDAPIPDDAHRATVALADRERQLSVLADGIARTPITAAPERVAHHVVDAARSVLGDGTWSLAVLDSRDADLLRPGVYHGGGDDEPSPITDLHRWASVSAGEGGTSPIEGPWGRFLVLPSSAETVRSLLLAPWEGRSSPARPDLALLQLIGRHATTALEHALLYGQVRAQAAALDRMAGVQQDFLRGITHDLQTPLTTIRALASEIRSTEPVSEQASRDLDMIEHQSDRLRRMVGQLLAVSRLDAGALQPRQELVNPRATLERTWAALRAPGRDLHVDVTGPPMLGVADPDRFEQVLWAVLENAVRYSPAGSPIEVTVAPGPDQTNVEMRVTDHGTGMDAETVSHAFDPFYRAPGARELAPDGSGIGLHAARGLMQAMEGTIELESALGSGTTVVLSLPAEIADAELEDPHP